MRSRTYEFLEPRMNRMQSILAFKTHRIRPLPNKALQLTFDPSPKPALRVCYQTLFCADEVAKKFMRRITRLPLIQRRLVRASLSKWATQTRQESLAPVAR